MLESLLLDLDNKREGTVYTPLGERVHGLVSITEGVSVLLLGKRGWGLSLKYAFWGARTNCRVRTERNPPPLPKPEPEYCEAEHSLVPLATQSKVGLPDQTDVTCDREKGHDGPHAGYLGAEWHWVDS